MNQQTSLPAAEDFEIGVEQAMKALGVTQPRLSQLTSRGSLPAIRKKVEGRAKLYYRKKDILDFLSDAGQHEAMLRACEELEVFQYETQKKLTKKLDVDSNIASKEERKNFSRPKPSSLFLNTQNLGPKNSLVTAESILQSKRKEIANRQASDFLHQELQKTSLLLSSLQMAKKLNERKIAALNIQVNQLIAQVLKLENNANPHRVAKNARITAQKSGSRLQKSSPIKHSSLTSKNKTPHKILRCKARTCSIIKVK